MRMPELQGHADLSCGVRSAGLWQLAGIKFGVAEGGSNDCIINCSRLLDSTAGESPSSWAARRCRHKSLVSCAVRQASS